MRCIIGDTIIHFTSDDLRIIKNLDPNKAHDHDMISIQIVKFVMALFAAHLN